MSIIAGTIIIIISFRIKPPACEQIRIADGTGGDYVIAADKQVVTYEQAAYRTVCLGFPLLTLGLLLGSWWDKLAWGDYWGTGIQRKCGH